MRFLLALVVAGCGEADTSLLLEEPPLDAGSNARPDAGRRDAGTSPDGGMTSRPYLPLACSPPEFTQPVGVCSTWYFECINVDDRAIHLETAEIVGDRVFTLDDFQAERLDPGEPADIFIVYCPEEVTTYTAQLRLRADEVFTAVDLIGTAFIPEEHDFDCAVDSFTIGPVAVGEQTFWAVTCVAATFSTLDRVDLIPPTAGASLVVERILYAGAQPLPTPAEIQPGDIVQTTITYAPTEPARVTADLALHTPPNQTRVALEFIAQ